MKIKTTKHLLQIAATPEQADAALKAGLITKFERAQLARYFKTQINKKWKRIGKNYLTLTTWALTPLTKTKQRS